jgi:hypothetical protein
MIRRFWCWLAHRAYRYEVRSARIVAETVLGMRPEYDGPIEFRCRKCDH